MPQGRVGLSLGGCEPLNSLTSQESVMPHVSPWLEQVLKEHISGMRPPSALVERIARQFVYGPKTASAAGSTNKADDAPSK
jgi:hypothetical protein